MAVGVIYTELDLDFSKFEKNQQKLLKSATSTSLAVEKNWQTLGAKSDAIFGAMANSAINAYNMIANRSKTSADEQFRAQSAMVAKINTINQQINANPLYETLGIKSQAAYKAQEAAIMSSYNTIKNSGTASAQDLINIERAKNTKLKELNKEMVGEHEMSMASMTRAVLRFYAAYYVISAVVRAVGSAFMEGVATIDKMQVSAVTVAATITNLQGTSGDVAENYKKNLAYAKALVPVLMQIDAASFANLEQVQLINRAMAMHGVILDGNNKKQIAAATALTNTIAMFTVGQNKEQQATQETNALLNGEITTRNRIALMIDQMIKRQGDYKDGLKGLNAEAQKHGDWLERISPYLVGINAAAGDISKTWEAVKTSLQTTWMILQTEIFADFYKGLVTGGQGAIGWARENASEIGKYFRIAFNAVGDAIGAVWGILKGFGPLMQDWGMLIAPIAYGYGVVLAALKPIGEAIGNAIASTYLLGKAIVSTVMAASSLAHFDYEGAKIYWDAAKKGYAEVGDLTKKNFNLITTGVADAVVAYDKQYNAAKKAASAGYVPTAPPGKDSGKDSAKEAADYLKKLQDESTRDLIKGAEEEIAITAKMNADDVAEYKKRYAETDKMEADSLTAWLKSIDDKEDADIKAGQDEFARTKKNASDRLTAERDVYKDLRGYDNQYYEASKALIDKQAKTYRDLGVSEVAVIKWVAEETRKAEIKKLEASDDFMDGVSAGLKKLKAEQVKWGQAGAAVMKTMSTSMASTFSNVFEDAYKKDLKSIKDYSTAIFDSIRKTFFDKVGQMAADKAITLLFETKWTEAGADVLGIVNKVLGLASNIDWGYDIGSIGGNYSKGGAVKGSAEYAGDHPGNDTVPAWLSPGEVVIRRGAVNSDTAAILDYINRFGQPPQYAFGGRVMNQVTDTPGRGYWGFGSIIDAVTAVMTGGASLAATAITGGTSLGAFIDRGGGSIYDWIHAFADPTGSVTGGTRMLGAAAPPWMDQLVQILAPVIGSIWGPGGAAAGAGIAADWHSGATGQETDRQQAMMNAGIAAVLTYVAQGNAGAGWSSGTAEAGYAGATLTDTAISAAKKYAVKWAINEALGAALGNPENGQMTVSYMGANDNGLLASLSESMREIAPRQYAVSARNGLDYVPYDNFPILAHKGERVQTAEQAKGGGGGDFKIQNHIYIDGKEIKILSDSVVVERNRRGVNSTTRVYQ